MAENRQALVRSVEDDHWWFVAQREVVAELVAEARPGGGRVLDVGCGTGRVLAELPATYERVGLEPSEEGRRIGAARSPDIEFVGGTGESMPFPDGHFDVVLCLDVISDGGVRDDAAVLREIGRVLRPGGTLVLHAAAYEWLRSGHDLAVGTGRRYTRRRILRLLEQTGFQVRASTYRVSALLPVAAVVRLVFRRDAQSDVGPVRPGINRALTALSRAENRAVRAVPAPFGLSILAVATR